MKKSIFIKAGNVRDILAGLDALRATFGNGATLGDVAEAVEGVRLQRLKKTVKKQLEEITEGLKR